MAASLTLNPEQNIQLLMGLIEEARGVGNELGAFSRGGNLTASRIPGTFDFD